MVVVVGRECQRIKVLRSRVYPLGQLPTIKVAGILYARKLQKKCQYFFCVKLFGKASILGASKILREFWAREFQIFCHKKAGKPVIFVFEKSEGKKKPMDTVRDFVVPTAPRYIAAHHQALLRV